MASDINIKQKITNKMVSSLAPGPKLYRAYDTAIPGFVIRIQPSGTLTYYFEYRNEAGKNRSFHIGRHGQLTAEQAREIAKDKAADHAKGLDVQALKAQKKSEAKNSLDKVLNHFLENHYDAWATANLNSGKASVMRIKHVFSHLLGRKMDEITLWDIDKISSERKKQGKSPTTINRDNSALKAALSKAVEWKIIAVNPLKGSKPLKTDSNASIRYLTTEEEKRLLQALINREETLRQKRASANKWRAERGYDLLPYHDSHFVDHLMPMVILTIYTGMRRGELFSLKWKDINFEEKTLTIQGKTSKNKTTRHIYLHDDAISTLRGWEKSAEVKEYVFPGKEGKRLDNINKAWKSLVSTANLKDFRWHDLRHHFASKLVMQGTDLNTVRELLGHSDIRMTLRYAHLDPSHKAAEINKLKLNYS